MSKLSYFINNIINEMTGLGQLDEDPSYDSVEKYWTHLTEQLKQITEPDEKQRISKIMEGLRTKIRTN